MCGSEIILDKTAKDDVKLNTDAQKDMWEKLKISLSTSETQKIIRDASEEKIKIGRTSRRALSRILDTKELLELAVNKFREANRKYPNYADIYFDLGVIYKGIGKIDDAVENLKHSININPRFSEAHQALAEIYYDIGDYAGAEREYTLSATLTPEYPDIHLGLGKTYKKLNMKKNAIRHLRRAIEINPNYKEAEQELDEIEKIIKES
jgi:tetratricopeptide (TPR) repeat protein